MARILIRADSRFPVDRQRIRRTINQAGGGEAMEISVYIVGNRKMKQLNQQYRREKHTALVLAFPLEAANSESSLGFANAPDGVLRLGDIVISYPLARQKAIKEKVLIDEKIEELVKHGMRHLLGIK